MVSIPRKLLWLLAIIPVYQIWDLVALYRASGISNHLLIESAASLVFIYVLSVFVRDQIRIAAEMADLRTSAESARRALQEKPAEATATTRDFIDVINAQFDAWRLTLSEKDVAMLLIKGLSLDEIAAVRESKSKTVRQHAVSVYAKAGLEGRHQLAAYFLEDLLAPPSDKPAQ